MPSTPSALPSPPPAPSPSPPPPPPPPPSPPSAAASTSHTFQHQQQASHLHECVLRALDPPLLHRIPAAASTSVSSSVSITFNGRNYPNLPPDSPDLILLQHLLLTWLQHIPLFLPPSPSALGSTSLALGSMSSSSALPPAPPPQVLTPAQLQLAYAALPPLPNFRHPTIAAPAAPAAPVPA
ncbi:hypothetical protein BJV74DRAFT_884182 [Russula compacta]|nr:hypothetical protein BJV74DRAFT_884182 [Russula compacta]